MKETLRPGEKYNTTVKEAAAYFAIGEKKLRRLAEEYPEAGFALMNGSHMRIKRKTFEKFIVIAELI